MRKAINENPQVQIAVVAAMGVIFAFIMFTMVLKKDPPPSSDSTTPTTATAGSAPAASGTAVGADPAAATAVDPASTSTPPSPDVPVTPGAAPPADAGKLEAGKGVPKKVVDAYDSGQAVALLILDRRGLSDRAGKRYRGQLESVNDVKLFNVPPKDIARYARITQGVAVSRTPALVVIKPEDLSAGQPVATVSYGFRSVKSAKQALRDALYEGSPVNYYPQ